LTVIGAVWLSIGVFQLILPMTGAAIAAILVGAALVAGPAIALLPRSRQTANQTPIQAAAPLGNQDELMALVTQTAEKMASTTPLKAMAFAVTGGVLSVHLPSAVTPLLLRIAAQRTEIDTSSPAS
jgi:hypothetical protein